MRHLITTQNVRLQLPHGARCRVVRQSATVRRGLVLVAHGQQSGHHASAVKEDQKTRGFVGEMRKVAMKLHTKEQAPKEGKAENPKPAQKFAPTREGYLRFLAESKVVYETLERIVKEAPVDLYKRFQNTGLERTEPLEKDIAWMRETYGLEAPELTADGPGLTYSRLLEELARSDPPAFICHYYNTYFAHTAGGRMIGSKVAAMCLDSAELEFYKYDGDLTELLEAVRAQINEAAEAWAEDQKNRCLEETTESFKYSGAIMQTIMSTPEN